MEGTLQLRISTMPAPPSPATGDAYADFLLGYPSSTDVTIGTPGGRITSSNFGAFVQDDWKITPKLTLNLGLRYDYFSSLPRLTDAAPRLTSAPARFDREWRIRQHQPGIFRLQQPVRNRQPGWASQLFRQSE